MNNQQEIARAQAVHAARLQRAKEYAAQARERNKAPCQCDACVKAEMLPKVRRIMKGWAACSA